MPMTHAPDHPRADPIVPTPAASSELGVHPTTLRRYARQGLLTLRRVGPRKTGVLRSELDRFKARTAHAPPTSPISTSTEGDA